MRPDRGSAYLRKGRVSLPGQVYLLTTRTQRRDPLLARPEAAQVVLEGLLWLDGNGRIALDAAVVMPDHVHFVAALGSAALPEVMRSFKGYTGHRINELLGRTGPLWQPQYHDHAVRKDEVLREVVDYCLTNPVRAGLVGDLRDYPHWWCRWEV
jgi:REP element-mobilizing transposase RayT